MTPRKLKPLWEGGEFLCREWRIEGTGWRRKTHVKRPKSLELPHWKPRGTKRARKPAPTM
jgi:hypothetical protein